MDTKRTAAFHIGCIQGAAKGIISDLEFVQKFTTFNEFDKKMFDHALTKLHDILSYSELAFESHLNQIIEVRKQAEAWNNE